MVIEMETSIGGHYPVIRSTFDITKALVGLTVAILFIGLLQQAIGAELHGTFCRLDANHRPVDCTPMTGTVTYPDGVTDASSELSRSYRGQLGAPIATEVPETARDHGASPYSGHGH